MAQKRYFLGKKRRFRRKNSVFGTRLSVRGGGGPPTTESFCFLNPSLSPGALGKIPYFHVHSRTFKSTRLPTAWVCPLTRIGQDTGILDSKMETSPAHFTIVNGVHFDPLFTGKHTHMRIFPDKIATCALLSRISQHTRTFVAKITTYSHFCCENNNIHASKFGALYKIIARGTTDPEIDSVTWD